LPKALIMLKNLRISNYALIEHLDISFEGGFSAITGETGAGKSILLGALGLVLGKRADSSILMDKNSKCIVEAVFDVSELDLQLFFIKNELDGGDECIMRREIAPTGKSRAFINDSPVNLLLLKELGNKLVDVHSQHESLQLPEASFQLKILDDLASNELDRKEFETAYVAYQAVSTQIDQLANKEAAQKAEGDFIRFQLDELDKLRLQEGEYDEIEAKLLALNHASEIASSLFDANQLMEDGENTILQGMTAVTSALCKIEPYLPAVSELAARAKSCHIELKDLGDELRRLESEALFNPTEIEQLSQRMDEINHLLHKHRLANANDLLLLKKSFEQKLQSISFLGDELITLREKKAYLAERLFKAGKALTESRTITCPLLEKSITSILSNLGMPHARFMVKMEHLDSATTTGFDKVQFLFTANKGGRLEDMAKIASGGEMSRLMLAIKSLISEKKLMPTIVFDEIDTGVSGDIAGKVGRIMASMSDKMQLISITHLPQIAGKARHHLLVYKKEGKQRTTSMITHLNHAQRIEEIARMLSDDAPTPASMDAARELIVGH
jgi:DNA repair protein RecN (Recombination protein N)